MTDRRRDNDKRRRERHAWRHWYKRKAWTLARNTQLHDEPTCRMCRDAGWPAIPATVVDHITPHRGEWELFIDPSNLQSLCKPCHDGPKQSHDVLGYAGDIGADGWPTDPSHPANSKDLAVSRKVDRPGGV